MYAGKRIQRVQVESEAMQERELRGRAEKKGKARDDSEFGVQRTRDFDCLLGGTWQPLLGLLGTTVPYLAGGQATEKATSQSTGVI
jgi:hypothetical protein